MFIFIGQRAIRALSEQSESSQRNKIRVNTVGALNTSSCLFKGEKMNSRLSTNLVMKVQDCIEVWDHVEVILTAVLSEMVNILEDWILLQ